MPCPSEDTLIDLVDGIVDAERHAELNRHLDGCPACQAVVATLASQAPRDEPPPDRYALMETLGQGGMGIVYAAFDRVLERRVAVKVMRPGGNDAPSKGHARAQILKEAQALARLSHPNIVTVFDAGLLPSGDVFVAMELLSGTTVREWLDEPRPWRDVVDVFLAVGDGLVAAHTEGLVHRDIKPDNILVADAGVWVTDFGLAQPYEPSPDDSSFPTFCTGALTDETGETDPELGTRSRVAVGTPPYMPPEQHRGTLVGPASDQFSFCVALFECLVGHRPFRGPTNADFVAAILAQEIEVPRPWPQDVPPDLLPLLQRGLSAHPSDRFPDMPALLRGLRRIRFPRTGIRRLLLLGVAATGGGVALAWGWSEPEPACTDLAQPLVAVYDDGVRQHMAERFARASPAGMQVWIAVQARLDEWSTRWLAARRDACEATRVRGEQSEQRLDERMQCLDERLRDLQVYLATVAEPDRAIVRRAMRATSVLTAPEDCRDAKGPQYGLPDDPALAQRVRGLRDEIVRIRTANAAGRLQDGLPWAVSAFAAAQRTEYRPVMAEAGVVLGRSQALNDHGRSAEQTLREAMALATSIGYDEVVATAAVALVGVVGSQPQRRTEAERLATQASAALERIGDPASLRMQLLASEIERAKTEQRYEDAEAAIEWYGALIDEDDDPAAEAIRLNELGDLRRLQERNEEALVLQTRALDLRRAVLGHDHPDVARDLNNRAITLAALGRRSEAVETLEEALPIQVAGYGDDHAEVARIHNNLGMSYRGLGEIERARHHLERALAIKSSQEETGSVSLGSTYANLAVLEYREGNRVGALELFGKALESYEPSLGPTHGTVLTVRHWLVDINLELERIDDAEALLDEVALPQAPEGRTAAPSPDVAVARVEIAIARGRSTDAVSIAEEHRARITGDASSTDGDRLASSLALGKALVADGQLVAARRAFEAARTELDAGSQPTYRDAAEFVLASAEAFADVDAEVRCRQYEVLARWQGKEEPLPPPTERKLAHARASCAATVAP